MKLVLPVLLACALAGSSFGFAQQTQPDNSAVNANQTRTADNQSNGHNDRTIAANIRKAVIADKGMSIDAYNCKIIVVHGKVTLKGPVKSEDEKNKIAADAASVVSAASITNQLTVKQ